MTRSRVSRTSGYGFSGFIPVVWPWVKKLKSKSIMDLKLIYMTSSILKVLNKEFTIWLNASTRLKSQRFRITFVVKFTLGHSRWCNISKHDFVVHFKLLISGCYFWVRTMISRDIPMHHMTYFRQCYYNGINVGIMQ